MARMPILIEQKGPKQPGKEFLLEYERAVLFLLHQEGFLDQAQVDACVHLLKHGN